VRFDLKRRGLLIVISAPSGGGKSAVLRRLLAADPTLSYSISYTSRPPRGDEVDGRHYHFVSRERFEEMAAANEFYEFAEVHGNLYGTCAKVIDESIDGGRDVAMDLDVQGGLNVKLRRSRAVLVFLMPPSIELLEERLRGRASDSEEQIQLRMKNARREIEHWDQYDYIVMNRELETTVEAVRAIVQAERCRAARFKLIRES
jgi:guanylate kinase